MYRVKGHYPTIQNGLPSYVIVEFRVMTKEEAEEEVLRRKSIYTNLEIIEE